MSAATFTAVLAALGLGAIISAVIAGLFSKRKIGAEATEIITKAATGVVESMERQLALAEKRSADREAQHDLRMAEMAAAHVAERNSWRMVLQLHVSWDAIATAKLLEQGIELPAAPPLLPSERFVDEHGYPIHRHVEP